MLRHLEPCFVSRWFVLLSTVPFIFSTTKLDNIYQKLINVYCLGSDEALDYSGATLLAMDFSIDGQKFHSKNFFSKM